MFRRGVDYLLKTQVNDTVAGQRLVEGGAHREQAAVRPSPTTMWAVIGLAGAYGAEPTGALQVVRQQGDKAAGAAISRSCSTSPAR